MQQFFYAEPLAHPKKGKTCKKWSSEMKAAHSIRCKQREEKKRLLGQGE